MTPRGTRRSWARRRGTAGRTILRRNCDTESQSTRDSHRSATVRDGYQDKPSRAVFSGLKARAWVSETNTTSSEATYNADGHVLCRQTATAHDQYRQVDVSQCNFYVLSRDEAAATGFEALGLASVRRMAGAPIGFADLARAVHSAPHGMSIDTFCFSSGAGSAPI